MRLATSAATHLRTQQWSGNVRELRNLAERVALLVADTELTQTSFGNLGAQKPASIGDESLFAIQSFELFKETAERLYLKRKLDDNGWNIKRTSEQLGMQRSNLYKKIERYALKDAGDDPV